MHGHGIAGALWSAVRRLASVPGGIKATVAVVAVAAIFAGAVPRASAAVEYTYTGGNFTEVSGPYTTSDRVTGDVIFNNPLIPSSANDFLPTSPLPFSFNFSDGVNTVSSAAPGAGIAGSVVEFDTNAADQIVSVNLGVGVDTPKPSQLDETITVFGQSSGGLSEVSPSGTGRGQSLGGGTWSGPVTVSSSCASDLQHAVHPQLLNVVSNSGEPIDITATFSPSTGVTLAQAATDCGVSQFNWQQTIDILPSPSPFFANDNPTVSLTAPPTFLDPVPGGYTYPLSCSFLNTSSATDYAFPFYYAVNGPVTDCMSLDYPSRHPDASTFTFFDSPSDRCLLSGFLSPFCGFTTAQGFLEFTTQLVGVNSAGNPVPLPVSPADDQFIWSDTFDGCRYGFGLDCEGGITIFQLDSADSSNPATGTGGITLLSVNGTPVPEPPGIAILASGIGVMLIVRKRKMLFRRKPTSEWMLGA
jgi:hypothetical protein